MDREQVASRTVSGPPGADAAVVGPYLAKVLDEPAWQHATVEIISGGRSNLTYGVSSPAGELVLRRPPLRAVRPTAHDMRREHKVISALGGTAVPVPETLHLCTDPEVLGAPFYLMRRVDGHIIRAGMPAGYAETEAERAAMAGALVEVLAGLHAVEPAAVNLTDFGRPEGYLQRQVKRWVGEWDALRDQDRPEVDRLAADLARSVPDSPTGSIVHGDYRLDNVMMNRTRPDTVEAVLDWEMSTLGDPLADLGLLLVYWRKGKPRPFAENTVGPAVTVLPGFPDRDGLVERYAAATGRDVSALPWYVAFGFFKLAIVVAGILARQKAGAMNEDIPADYFTAIDGLITGGRHVLDTDEVG
jgi:aminoglycoside phosphotransferase (APT) family kinase protein